MVSADTVKLLVPDSRGARQDELVLSMTQNRIAFRIGGAARRAGLGESYSVDRPSP